jgi:uncharacterized Zn finger protein (UPF0148 family)
MTTISEIFQTYGPEYLDRYQATMPGQHRKVVEAIITCRTSACGVALYQCEQCGEPHILYRSCGNRHCPTCQHHKSRKWLENQMNRQLPGHHFMITFTVPETLRRFVRSNQRTAYSAMFQASSEAIKILAADEKYVGGDLPGFLGVLHTWGRQLHYHPHIHYVVPAGALSTKEQRWHPSRIDFFVPVRALSRLFRAKFRDEIAKVGLLGLIPLEVWQTDWNVNWRAPSQIPRSLCLQSGHLKQPPHQSRKPHRLLPLQKTTEPPLADHGPRGDGVHQAFPPARPPNGLHEGPLLRLHEPKLIGLPR